MTIQLRGVLTALATPFAADGNVDEASLRALVDRSIAGGVHSVVACGSTGEFSTLSSDERRLVVETVVDHVAARVPVIAQTGATSTAEAIRLSRHAQSAGADVVMAVTPYYEPLSIGETLSYLRAVAGSRTASPSTPISWHGVTPWNYPLLMAAWKIAPILAAGNTLVTGRYTKRNLSQGRRSSRGAAWPSF